MCANNLNICPNILLITDGNSFGKSTPTEQDDQEQHKELDEMIT